MLVLTRRAGETVMIGDDIIVAVLETKNGRVRLGFSCPDHLTIDRDEVRAAKIRNGDYPKGDRNADYGQQ